MIDAILPWLKLAGLILYVVLVYRVVRKFAARSIPRGGDRKALLYILAFGGVIAVTGLAVALQNVLTEGTAMMVGVLLAVGLLSSIFAVAMAD